MRGREGQRQGTARTIPRTARARPSSRSPDAPETVQRAANGRACRLQNNSFTFCNGHLGCAYANENFVRTTPGRGTWANVELASNAFDAEYKAKHTRLGLEGKPPIGIRTFSESNRSNVWMPVTRCLSSQALCGSPRVVTVDRTRRYLYASAMGG